MSLETLEVTPLPLIVGDIAQNRRSGVLTVIAGETCRMLFWASGDLVLVVSSVQAESLESFALAKGVVNAPFDRPPQEAVAAFHDAVKQDLSSRQKLLREWLSSVVMPMFSLDEGTTAFNDEEPVAPEHRVFLLSTPALLLDGVRSITNGLVLRRSLGDLTREIAPSSEARTMLDMIGLSAKEHQIATALERPEPVGAFLKRFAQDSSTAARTVIGMLMLGVFEAARSKPEPAPAANAADMERDLALLAAIGPNDGRSLRAVALSRQLGKLDFYQVLDVTRAASRDQIVAQAQVLRNTYSASKFPVIVHEAVNSISKKIDEAVATLTDQTRRAEYDRLLKESAAGGDLTVQQKLARRSIAQQNFARARDLSVQGDYYGAIVLLKQAVLFVPDDAQAWYLLGSCQERNPKWLREAAVSFQRALAIEPTMVDALVSLGDLYHAQGLASRAQNCYEDVLRIDPVNQQATSRLSMLKKK